MIDDKEARDRAEWHVLRASELMGYGPTDDAKIGWFPTMSEVAVANAHAETAAALIAYTATSKRVEVKVNPPFPRLEERKGNEWNN